jgi:pimeloyl-ACP methyl ester carboxylesterase
MSTATITAAAGTGAQPDELLRPVPGAAVIGRLGQLARAARLPLAGELAAAVEVAVTSRDYGEPRLDAGGLPVLVVGGLASSATTLAPLTGWLGRLGCQPSVAPVGGGVDCGERSTRAVLAALHRLADETGRAPVVVAHSRGGQFARAAAVRDPLAVRALVTLGSPLNRLLAVHPLLRAEVTLLGLVGLVGVPGVLRPSCLWGACCRALRQDLAAPFPAGVPFVSVYSRDDQVVDWRSSLDPAARHRHVATTHTGLIASAAAFDVIADELAGIVATAEDAALAA